MKRTIAIAHMRVAYIYADLSHCIRRKVGCVIVKNDSIIAIGYNGTPPGEDNCCELSPDVTKPDVIHAEDNAFRKLTKSSESADGASIFVTTAPCTLCAPRIIDAGVKEVYFVEMYRCEAGIKYLMDKDISVIQLAESHFK
jgi:dCMP deaminase